MSISEVFAGLALFLLFALAVELTHALLHDRDNCKRPDLGEP